MTSWLTRRSLLGLLPIAAVSSDWPSFRGPTASGVADGAQLPESWDPSSGKGVRWRIDVPGLSHSSPIVVDRRVFLVTAIPATPGPDYKPVGGIDSAQDAVTHEWKLYGIDAMTGKTQWSHSPVQAVPRIKRHQKASHANTTPVADRRFVAAFLGSEGLHVYSAAGKPLWKKDLGTLTVGLKNDLNSEWGFSSSPVLHKDTLVVQCDTNKEDFVAAFDVRTGRELWRHAREEFPAWSTPIVIEGPKGAQLITTSPRFTRSLDLATGKELWKFADETEVKTPTPIAAHGLIFISGGYPQGRTFFALNLDGTLAWRNDKGGPYVPTPIVYREHLYVLGDSGIIGCYEAKTGKEVYRERLAAGASFSASPIAADGRLYLPSEQGNMYILQAGPKLNVLQTVAFGEPLMATPAIAGGVLYVRSLKSLYAIGGKA